MATRTLRFLTLSQVQRLHARLVTANGVPTQLDMLDSAVHSPTNLMHYAKQEDVFQLAANLAEKVMKNHAFQDGNKRTGLVAAGMFLRVNGYDLQDNDNDKKKKTTTTIARVSQSLRSLLLPTSGMLNGWGSTTSLWQRLFVQSTPRISIRHEPVVFTITWRILAS